MRRFLFYVKNNEGDYERQADFRTQYEALIGASLYVSMGCDVYVFDSETCSFITVS